MSPEINHQLFADTSSIAEIDKLMALGIFSGITTNPLIVAKEAGQSQPLSYYQELAKRYPEVPISIQLLDESLAKLIKQAQEFAEIGPNIVVKVPMFPDGRGLKLLPQLIAEGIKTNVTALMSGEQMLAVLRAGEGKGPTYASLFFNRIKDGGGDPIVEIGRSRSLIDSLGVPTKIITGSIRYPADIYEAFRAGTHILTVTPPVVRVMDIEDAFKTSSYIKVETPPIAKEEISHPQSIKFINDSQTAWNEFLASQQATVK